MERLKLLLSKPAIRLLDAALALSFFYLGTTKLLDGHGVAYLAALGVGPGRRLMTAGLEIAAGALLLAGASGYVVAPVVVAVATTEMLLFQRPPLVAAMCVGTHGFTTWARRTHERRITNDRLREEIALGVSALGSTRAPPIRS
jgi:uncharacterized membrane protein YphA (DoxX/SURF4 family)